mgnify:CR=1 FL=1
MFLHPLDMFNSKMATHCYPLHPSYQALYKSKAVKHISKEPFISGSTSSTVSPTANPAIIILIIAKLH